MTPLVKLVVVLCFGHATCPASRPLFTHTFAECARLGASMTRHAPKVVLGEAMFECVSVGRSAR